MALVGGKKNYEILVKNSGFSKLELVIPEGKSVVFLIDKRKSTSNENNDIVVDWNEVYIIEVVGDEAIDGKYRPVCGGNQSERSPDRFNVKFKLAGDYYFKLVNHPKNPPLCKIRVTEEQPLSFLITEEGFLPRIIRIEENSTIKWSWSQLAYPHSIYEAEYCDAHNGIFRITRELVASSSSGSFKRQFKEPGLYYFQTEARNYDQKHVCIVEVHQSYREHLVEILDHQFSPARVIVEEGDRVCFSWSKDKCQRKHCVYQIEHPQPNHPQSAPYYPVKDGFKWPVPTRSGTIWHTFDKCGVYYYSDMSDKECASYIGIVAVRQKSEHHVIEYDAEKSSFGIDLLTLETGDSIWWKWNNTQALVTIKLSDYSLIGNKIIETEKCRNIKDGCEQLDLNGIARSGVRSFTVKYAGIYYFDIYDGDNITTLTIVATSVQKDHKIAVSDLEAKPKILEIHPEDRVWFVWDETRKPKNIRQVNHQNELVEDGFSSGSLMESPGTFLHSFNNLGVYFFRTDNLNDILGAIVVVPEPTIQLVNVAEDGLNPDPIIIHVNDIVIWAFPKYQANNLVLIETDSDLLKYANLSQDIIPRRHLSYSFIEPGIYHFASPAFDDTVDPSNKDATKGLDNTIISSVIVDAIQDHTSIFVDSNGFHPSLLNVELGKNVLFDWETSSQAHNIIHVTKPNDKDNKLKIIEGPAAFNSGAPIVNNRFLHRFDEEGIFCVVSEGAADCFCLIRVLQSASKTSTPELVNEEPYVLYKYHKIFLDCKTPEATIHYTLDGSMPNKLSLLYDKDNAVIMGEEGINILRAIAFSEQNLTSDVFTSQRFYVIPNPEEPKKIYADTANVEASSVENEDWWQCIPKITYTIVGVGCVELSWETPSARALELISHYQIFLNKVTYRRSISPYAGRLLIKDLAGGKYYETILMVYPKGQHLVPQQSNIITIESPSKTSLGGPVISLKANSNKNQMTICWPSIDSKKLPIDYYRLLINGEKREIIKPNVGIHRITIENCKESLKYSIILVAIPKDGSVPLISNELEITLPLDLSEISLPDDSLRKLDKDYYNEYIEITEFTIEQTLIDSIKETSAVTEEKTPPHTAPYLSYDNYIIPNKDKLTDKNYMSSYHKIDTDNMLDTEKQQSVNRIGKDPMQINNVPNMPDYSDNAEFNEESNNIDKELIVIQSQILTESVADSADEELPIPMVGVFHLKTGTISIVWRVDRLPPNDSKLIHYVISLIGCEFGTSIKSENLNHSNSFECKMEQVNGIEVPAIQHSWIAKSNSSLENKFTIEGVLDTGIYQISVSAIYRGSDSTEYKRTSKVIDYTALGPPEPPRLRVNSVDIQSVTLEWIMTQYAKPDFIKGYRLIVNGEPNEVFEKNINEFMFRDLQPGFCYEIEILTLTNWMIGSSQPSNKITLVCPNRPQAPLITQVPSLRTNSVVIGWKPVEPRSSSKADQILFYKVFINRKFHGEIFSSNMSSYTYTISDLTPGKSYDVMVQSFCGERVSQPNESPKVSCIIESEFSNYLPVTPTSVPGPTRLKLAAISPDGIDITWAFPQQYGDASCCGYQLIKNGKCYGNLIPSEVNTFRISDVDIGETITLQIICLTNHPVGKYTALHNHPDYTMDQPQREYISNGHEDEPSTKSNSQNKLTDINLSYPACKPGPPLSVKFTCLVKPAVRVWTERITGYTATLFFQTSKMNSHFVDPEYFLISLWPGPTPIEDIRTIKTEKDFVNLSNLKPSTIYTIQVESRKEMKRSEDILDLSEKNDYKFISYSKSCQLQFQTASPPDPPTNLSIISTTCHAIKVAWDPPIDHGSEIIATRVDCYPICTDKPLHIFKELTPDCKTCIIDNLSEKTNYRITVTAITEEYFYQHKIKEIRKLPKFILEPVPWLPSAFIEAMTSGSDGATNLEWKLKHDNSILISWKPAKCYGTNQLVNQIICYQEVLTEYNSMAAQVPLQTNAKSYKLANLKVGSKYKIWVEAVVCIKLAIDTNSNKPDLEMSSVDHYKELKDHRCINVLSEPLVLRIPAPCEPVSLNLTSYSNETIDIYWAKPSLYTQQNDPDNPDRSLHVYRHLIGYKLEVNQIEQRSLEANENSCTLFKCKPLNTYSIVIVARTCLQTDAMTSSSLAKTEIDANEIDESYSMPLLVKTFAEDRPDQLNYICAQYEEIVDTNDPKSIGRIRVDWAIEDDRDVSQFNVIWYSAEESLTLRRSFDPAARSCYIPVTKSKCIYEISLETIYRKAKQTFNTERLFIEVPGSPDAPSLWLLEQKDNNVTIHWSEPRMYPTVPVSGYQVYLNNLKVGAKIDKDIVRATLPLKPNRMYKITIQALSSKPEYSDSALSNPINVSTSLTGLSLPNSVSAKPNTIDFNKKGLIVDSTANVGNKFNDSSVIALKKFYENENDNESDGEATIPIKINKITEDYFELDWSKFNKTDYFDEFKIQLHCLNTNEHSEVRVPANTFNNRIKKLRSGFSYSVRITTVKNNTVLNKSKYLIIQTSAPPDTPALKLRACNFKYITIEWNRPYNYGEAQIVAYKIFLDGKVEAVISSEQTSFTLSKGEPCHEYTFQIQAITADENLSSLLSTPLNVVWPGIQVPNLRQLESETGTLKIAWDEPSLVGNAKISYYHVVATSETTTNRFSQGPIDNNILECEFIGLTLGKYKVNLEVYIFGVPEPFVSKPIHVDFGYKPESPKLYAQVQGLEQRNKLDKIACSLVNKRDRLLRIATNNSAVKQSPQTKGILPKAMSALRQLDEALDDCVKLIENYTGYFIVNLNWSYEQVNPFIKVVGYKVYVNGKQYGSDLNKTINSIRVKLSLERAINTIYVTSFTEKPKMESQKSNRIELMSETFFPFSFYCLSNVHQKSLSWPEPGCCSYRDTLNVERHNLSKTREPINLGLLNEPIPVPSCQIIEVSSGKSNNLIENRNNDHSTVVFFWTKWCLPSIRILNFLVMFVQRNNPQNDFVICHCGNDNPSEMQALLKQVGYTHPKIRFVIDIQLGNNKSSIDPFDIRGVPTMILINSSGLITWKGRYCAYDYQNFEYFIYHTISESDATKCPVNNCLLCQHDISIEKELIDVRSMLTVINQYSDTLERPNDTHSNLNRIKKQDKITTKQLITSKMQAYNVVRCDSEHGLHSNDPLTRSNKSLKMSRSGSIDQLGFCYYHKKASK